MHLGTVKCNFIKRHGRDFLSFCLFLFLSVSGCFAVRSCVDFELKCEVPLRFIIRSVVNERICVITRERTTPYANEARSQFCRYEASARELPKCTQTLCDFSFQRKLKSPPLAFSRKWKRIETNGDSHNVTAYKYGIKRKFLPCQIRILSCRFLSILRNITGMEFK